MSNKLKKKTNPFYSTSAWSRLSKQYKINNPLCVMCLDREIVRAVKYVDHKIPILVDYSLRLDVNNLQSLCAKCHAKKTKAVDVQLLQGKEARALSSSSSNGLPTDVNHHWNK